MVGFARRQCKQIRSFYQSSQFVVMETGPAGPSKTQLCSGGGGGGGRFEMRKTKRVITGGAGAGRAPLDRRHSISLMGNNNWCRFHHLSCVIMRHPCRARGPPQPVCVLALQRRHLAGC